MSDTAFIKLRVPRQDLVEFTPFQLNAEAAAMWVGELPFTNTTLVAHQLEIALSELNRVALSPGLRFEIIEALSSHLQVTLATLSLRFLNQPLVLPTQPRQMLALANSLYSLTTTAYSLVAIEAIQHSGTVENVNPARLVCEALHRALSFAGQKILNTLQLHRAIEQNGWLELHQLYILAEHQQLTELPVVDPLYGDSTIKTRYLQNLMLGCCRPNQLRQADLLAIQRCLLKWGNLVELTKSPSNEGLFIVDLDSDRPPVYKSIYAESAGDQCHYIDPSALVEYIERVKAEDHRWGKTAIILNGETTIPFSILDHMISSYGSMRTRSFTRTAAKHTLQVSVGLRNTQYYVAGGRTFEQLLHGDQHSPAQDPDLNRNPFLQPLKKEIPQNKTLVHEDQPPLTQGSPKPSPVDKKARDPAPEEQYPIHSVSVVDVSPGGYCLEWTTELPRNIKTGDIVGIHEGPHQDWDIAVIRWISQLENNKTLLGIELLSPRAIPYGARIYYSTDGEAELMPVLLLPEVNLVGQSQTLITPRARFRENQKVTLMRNGEKVYVQLQRQISFTGSFAQFDFQYIEHLDQEAVHASAVPLYDSVWNDI
ncbi:MAG: hypothetical protein HOC23_13235 [Halieaceae bacterium]|nr:hypothetical protein [Halieaceae bacterium]